ncbi:MAG: hypothetical protein FD123_3688 [Bacteroidetes bacterium]|nr:MAG: hypothetical protein FD123_3688 [Bacteroidota bacterium]
MMHRINVFFLVAAFAFLFSCHKGKNNPESCNGDNRREVKLMTDVLAPEIDTAAIFTTIDSLGGIPVPEVKGETGRLDLEKKVFTVRCRVDEIKKCRDGDYHLRLISGEDSYLITEAPNPGCDYAQQSAWHNTFISVRNFIESNDLEGKTVTITGVAFVDIDHHYKRKQAKNNLELHPILKISF